MKIRSNYGNFPVYFALVAYYYQSLSYDSYISTAIWDLHIFEKLYLFLTIFGSVIKIPMQSYREDKSPYYIPKSTALYPPQKIIKLNFGNHEIVYKKYGMQPLQNGGKS